MREMNCKRAAEFLPLHAAGDLEGRCASEVAAHVIACGDCRRLAEEFRESRALLVEAFGTPEFGAEFYSGIRSSVLEQIARDREPSTPSFVAALFGRRLAYATTFAVALIAFAFALQHSRGGVRETTPQIASGQPNVDTLKPDRRRESETSPQLNAKKNESTPKLIYTATSPRREPTRRDAPDRRREPMPTPVMRDDERAMIAQVTRASVDGAHEASEPASPANAAASASTTATAAPEVSRIEIQTADPNIRIIWLAPQKSEAPNPNEPKNENGERK
jgi:hypothetical protein